LTGQQQRIGLRHQHEGQNGADPTVRHQDLEFSRVDHMEQTVQQSRCQGMPRLHRRELPGGGGDVDAVGQKGGNGHADQEFDGVSHGRMV